MAKKAELLEKAKALKLDVSEKNTIAEITSAIAAATDKKHDETEIVAERKADVAKAGKRSEKARQEATIKAEKEARKSANEQAAPDEDGDAQPKRGTRPVARPRSERHGKKYRELAKKIEANTSYSLSDAVTLATETSPVAFDASVEVHVVLGVDPRQADQNIRTTVTLPHGTGKTIRVAAFVAVDEVATAEQAGADIAGEEAIIKQLDQERCDFDILVTTPQLMSKLGKYARLLGPRGLMPNPKSGTVATNVTKAIQEAKGGKVEYRVDKQSIVHLGVGKVSFGTDKLVTNIQAFFDSLQSVKPSSLKGNYIKSVHISSSMGPSITVDPTSL